MLFRKGVKREKQLENKCIFKISACRKLSNIYKKRSRNDAEKSGAKRCKNCAQIKLNWEPQSIKKRKNERKYQLKTVLEFCPFQNLQKNRKIYPWIDFGPKNCQRVSLGGVGSRHQGSQGAALFACGQETRDRNVSGI